MFGNIAKAVSGIVGKMSLPGGVLSSLMRGLTGEVDQRQAFVSVLLATAAHVNQKKNFNLELEINDLWTHLTVLRGQQPTGGVAGLLQTMGVPSPFLPTFNEGITKALDGLLKTK